jgi:hypothetical protein
MRLELETSLELFFPRKLKQTIIHPRSMFALLLLYLWHSKNIYSLPICASNDQKNKNRSIWWRNEDISKKCSMIGTFLLMSDFTIYQAYTSLNQSPSSCCFDLFWGTNKDRLHCSLLCWAMLWWCNWSLNECYGTSTLKKWPNPWQPMWGN